MKFVVDANVLFSFFWRDSFTRRLLVGDYFDLIAPEFSLAEIEKYKKYIIKKSGLSLSEFVEMKKELVLYVDFVGDEEYKDFLGKAKKISPDKDDVDYFALALKFGVGIWSNDKILGRQKIVEVLGTTEILKRIKD